MIILFSIIFSINQWDFIRHSIVLIPFVIGLLSIKKFQINNFYTLITNILIIIILTGFSFKPIDYDVKTEFDKFVDQNNDKIIFTFMGSAFNSAYNFKEWAVYCYGNSYDLWPSGWEHNDNLELLNVHNLDCENNLIYEEYSFFEKWKLLAQNNIRTRFYPHCIDEQIDKIIKNKAILTTFNNSISPFFRFEGEYLDAYVIKLKKIMLDKGYVISKQKVYDDFTVWGIKQVK